MDSTTKHVMYDILVSEVTNYSRTETYVTYISKNKIWYMIKKDKNG